MDLGGSRVRRIFIPYWVTLIILLICSLSIGVVYPVNKVLITIFDLSGINALIHTNIENIDGLAQAWFLIPLSICYAVMVFVKNKSKLDNLINNNFKAFLIISVIIQIIFAYLGIQLSYIFQFFNGYYFAKEDRINKCNFKLLTLIIFITCVIRLVTNRYIDGTILYDNVIARLSMNILATWIFVVEYKLCNYNKQIQKLFNNSFLYKIDKISYELYLTHYMFLQGNLSIKRINVNVLIQFIMFVILTITSAIVVNYVSYLINSKSITKLNKR